MKLKEISYIHSEAYAAGELKHGTISLIEEGTLVAAVSTQPQLYKKMISNIVEVKARGAVVLAVTTKENAEMEQFIGELIIFPGETTTETLRVSMYELAEYGYDEINRAFDTLTISAENALTADDTQVIGLNRITVK